MERRTYHGNINPSGLADYLVSTFNQEYGDTVAQKIEQGDHLFVQFGSLSHRGRSVRAALGLSISKTVDGVSVVTGQSNWFDLDDPAVVGGLIAGFFFPPLWLFPLARGISNYRLYQDIWSAVDKYCLQAGARPGNATTTHAVYCQNCGAMNDEHAQVCALCGVTLPIAPQGQPRQPQSQAQAAPGMIACPRCSQTVSAGKFCSNCAAPLTVPSDTRPKEKKGDPS
ncbi:MAG TPA: zinc ribbon domain-containing protein [Ktedonobacteraceae bacterium]|nr:zinc ribbon domain-containing protein [Ktedonobacteraceae bacterium]